MFTCNISRFPENLDHNCLQLVTRIQSKPAPFSYKTFTSYEVLSFQFLIQAFDFYIFKKSVLRSMSCVSCSSVNNYLDNRTTK